ncbi:MAG: WD40/YVTN/BNR-like repeat-containing protein, partial [Flavobacteriales bacterium]
MMLNSTLRSVAAGTAILGLSVMGWFTLSNSESEAYSPRLEEKAAEPNGALEIRQALLGDENGVVDYAGLAELRQKVEKKAKRDLAAKASSLSWHELGPDNIGGHTRAIEPFGANGLYAGSVSGGLWKSMNRGDNWTQITTFPSLMVGSIALAGNGDLYVGTGTAWEGASGEGDSGFRGEGIWRSTDAGASWEQVSGSGSFTATDALIADPTNADRVWFASASGYGSITNGDLDEVQGGTNAPSAASDVAIAPDGSYCLVAGVNGRVYRSINGDFADLELISQGSGQDGNPPQSGVGRARVDIALTADENGNYNAFAVYATSGGFFYGLFHSDNAGQSGS